MSAYFAFLRNNLNWLLAGALLAFMSCLGQTFFIAIFAGEIMQEYGLSDGEWGGTYALGTAASAGVMIWAGSLADRFRVRNLGMAIFALLGLACIFMSLNRSVFLLAFVIFSLRLTGQGMSMHASGVAMARWFSTNRGKALATAMLGLSLGEAALPLSFAAIKQIVEWRYLWLGFGAFCFAMIPILWFLLRTERTPAALAKTDLTLGMNGKHWTRLEVLKHPLFWSLIPALMFFPAFGTAFWFHQVHFAELKGWDHLALVSVFPLGTATLLASTALYGWAIDKWGPGRLLPFYLLPLVGAFVIHWYAPSLGWVAGGVILMGLAGGGQSTLPIACWAEFYGTKNIGSIKALAAAVMVLGSALGPGLSGWLIDIGVDLRVQYLFYAVSFLFAAIVMVPALRSARAQLALTA